MTEHTVFMLHKIAGMAVRRHYPLAGAQQQQQQRHEQCLPVAKVFIGKETHGSSTLVWSAAQNRYRIPVSSERPVSGAKLRR